MPFVGMLFVEIGQGREELDHLSFVDIHTGLGTSP